MTTRPEDAESAPVPTTFAGLRTFSYAPRGPWRPSEADDPIDLAEEYHLASRICAPFPAQALGPAGRALAGSPELAFALGRKALAVTGPRIDLPGPSALPTDLRAVVHSRRSGLPSGSDPLPLDRLATVLALTAGGSPGRPGFRVTPSGGAMYPIDLVIIAARVTDLTPGAHLYDPLGHALLPRGELDPADFHRHALEAVSPTGPPPVPAATLALVASFTRTRVKYGLRGYRFALLEAGHLAQAAITAATALGLATLPLGGFVDATVDDALEVDGLERSCVYLLGISALPPGEDHP